MEDNLAYQYEPNEELIGIMRGMVPTYRAPEEVNRGVKQV